MLTSPEWSALGLSVQVNAIAVVVSLPLAIFFAERLAFGRFRGRLLLESALSLPLVTPPVVTGFLLLYLFGRKGWLSSVFGAQIAFTWKAAAVASAVVSFPLMVRAIRQSMEGVEPELISAAQTLGAGRWRAFLSVTLPLTLPGIVSGCSLAFARGLGEFGATISFAGNIEGKTRTLPLLIFNRLQTPGAESLLWRPVLLCLFVASASLVLSDALTARNRRRRRARA